MKTGRIGSFTLALATVIVITLIVRIGLIPSQVKAPVASSPIPTNKEPVSLIPDFGSFDKVSDKKRAFFDYLRPVVNAENRRIENERRTLQKALDDLNSGHELSEAEVYQIQLLMTKYQWKHNDINTQSLHSLLERVDTIPSSMVLIQAANETGWGTSRFVREGLNFFGQWCFSKGCGLVPQSRVEGMNHEVAKFDSVQASVASYMRNINTNAAYSLLRSIRTDLRSQDKEPTAEQLIYGLINYSERKEAYIDELLEMLDHNQKYLVVTHAQ